MDPLDAIPPRPSRPPMPAPTARVQQPGRDRQRQASERRAPDRRADDDPPHDDLEEEGDYGETPAAWDPKRDGERRRSDRPELAAGDASGPHIDISA